MTPIFHFQHKVDHRWVPIGAGVGDGPEPVVTALEELRELSGGELPTGQYQAIAASGSGAAWWDFHLDETGTMIDASVPDGTGA